MYGGTNSKHNFSWSTVSGDTIWLYWYANSLNIQKDSCVGHSDLPETLVRVSHGSNLSVWGNTGPSACFSPLLCLKQGRRMQPFLYISETDTICSTILFVVILTCHQEKNSLGVKQCDSRIFTLVFGNLYDRLLTTLTIRVKHSQQFPPKYSGAKSPSDSFTRTRVVSFDTDNFQNFTFHGK